MSRESTRLGRTGLAARCTALALAVLAFTSAAEPIDNCASLLGSLSVELRHSRNLPTGARTTFTCPRDTSALIGASRQRVLNSLGPPDWTSQGEAGEGGRWLYRFTGKYTDLASSPGFPELTFEFDGQQQVAAVTCGRSL